MSVIARLNHSMKRYKELLAMPHVVILAIAAFPGRLGYSMIALGTFFKTQQATGSVATAGLAIGLYSLTGSFTAGIRAYALERWGQKWPLRILVPSYTGMIIAFNSMESRESLLITALLLGITAPPINLAVRPLWKDIVPDNFLRTAYALDTSMMSFTTVIGPILITFLSLSSRPELGLAVIAGLMLIGGLALSATSVSKNWIPEKKDKDQQKLWRDRAIQLLMFEGCFIGFGIGVFNVAVPAFATQEGVAQRVAWIFAAFGLASPKSSEIAKFVALFSTSASLYVTVDSTLFLHFCNSSAATKSFCSFAISASMPASACSMVTPSFILPEITNNPLSKSPIT